MVSRSPRTAVSPSGMPARCWSPIVPPTWRTHQFVLVPQRLASRGDVLRRKTASPGRLAGRAGVPCRRCHRKDRRAQSRESQIRGHGLQPGGERSSQRRDGGILGRGPVVGDVRRRPHLPGGSRNGEVLRGGGRTSRRTVAICHRRAERPRACAVGSLRRVFRPHHQPLVRLGTSGPGLADTSTTTRISGCSGHRTEAWSLRPTTDLPSCDRKAGSC